MVNFTNSITLSDQDFIFFSQFCKENGTTIPEEVRRIVREHIASLRKKD